jgi:methionyl-tRNA synthetase
MSETPNPPADTEPKESETKDTQTPEIKIDDFFKVDLRVAKVLEAMDHPNADKLIVLKIDVGFETRQICAGLRGIYDPADLVGKNIVVVANLAPRKMRGEESKGMLLAASDDAHEQVILLTPMTDIAPGSRVG